MLMMLVTKIQAHVQTSKAACKEGPMLVICSTTDLKLRPKGLSILTGYTLGGTEGKVKLCD